MGQFLLLATTDRFDNCYDIPIPSRRQERREETLICRVSGATEYQALDTRSWLRPAGLFNSGEEI